MRPSDRPTPPTRHTLALTALLPLARVCGAVLAAALLLTAPETPACAGSTARIAVASNFITTANQLAAGFTGATGHTVLFSAGATGQLYAQIAQGAPFDAFLAADAERPQRAEAAGLAVAGSRFTYAIGRLVLLSAEPTPAVHAPDATPKSGAGPAPDADPNSAPNSGWADWLRTASITRLAIANPATAPYGAAALQTLKAAGLAEQLAPRLVRGNNIAQAFQFVATGNADAGFVARALVIQSGAQDQQSWLIPADLHTPIRQDATLLTRGAENAAARAFLRYLTQPEARALIAAAGYDAP